MGHSTSPVRKSKYYKLTEPSTHDIDLKLIEYDNTMMKKIIMTSILSLSGIH